MLGTGGRELGKFELHLPYILLKSGTSTLPRIVTRFPTFVTYERTLRLSNCRDRILAWISRCFSGGAGWIAATIESAVVFGVLVGVVDFLRLVVLAVLFIVVFLLEEKTLEFGKGNSAVTALLDSFESAPRSR